MKKYRIPLKTLKDNDKVAIRFNNSYVITKDSTLNDDQVSLKYNGQPFTTFTSRALKGNKLAQAIFDVFTQFPQIHVDKAVELIKAYDDFKSRNRLDRIYDKDANFYQALKNKSYEDIVDRQNNLSKIDFIQSLVNFLTSNLGAQPINLKEETQQSSEELNEETGSWELVNVINRDVAYNAGAGMGCCIFGASPGSGERYGSPSSIKSSAESALKMTGNRSIRDYNLQRRDYVTITGKYEPGQESCYYVFRDPSRPNNSNDGNRYVLILLDEYHWTLWDDIDKQQIVCNVEQRDYDNYANEHNGEEGVYMQTVMPTPHFVDPQIVIQFCKRLQLANANAQDILARHHINADDLLQKARDYKKQLKEGNAQIKKYLDYSGSRAVTRENELADPETRRQREEEARRLQEVARILKQTPVSDELRFDFKNNFISFRVNITQSLYRRNKFTTDRTFQNWFPSLDNYDSDEEANVDSNIATQQNTIEIDNIDNFSAFLRKLLEYKDNLEQEESPITFQITYVIKPKAIADFLVVDTLSEEDKKELNRSDEIIRLDDSNKDEINTLIDLFYTHSHKSIQSLFDFLADFNNECTNIMVKSFYSPDNKRTYVDDLIKKPLVTKDDAKNIVDSILTDVNQHKYTTSEKEYKNMLLDLAFNKKFKNFNELYGAILHFKFPTSLFYDSINFNEVIENSDRIKKLTNPTSNFATRENNFIVEVRNIFFYKYYKLLRNDKRGSGRQIITKQLSEEELQNFADDINAIHIKLVQKDDLNNLRRSVKLSDDEINNIVNNGEITPEQAQQINTNNQQLIEEQSSNIVETKEDNDLVKEFKEKNFFTKSNDLPRIDNLDNVDFNDIEWADGYALHIGIVNRISNGNTVKSFLTNYKQALDDDDLDNYLSSYGLSNYLMNQINTRLLNDGKYAYLLTLLTNASSTSNESEEANASQETPQEEEIEEPEIIEEDENEDGDEIEEVVEEPNDEDDDFDEEPTTEEEIANYVEEDEPNDDEIEEVEEQPIEEENLPSDEDIEIIEDTLNTFGVNINEDAMVRIYMVLQQGNDDTSKQVLSEYVVEEDLDNVLQALKEELDLI